MPTFKQPVSALIVIYTPPSTSSGQVLDMKVLLLERADHPGYWQSVTGSCEPGETLVDMAIRAVSEETGIHASQYALTDWQNQNVYEIYPHWRHRYQPGVTENTEHVFGLRLPKQVAVRLPQSPT